MGMGIEQNDDGDCGENPEGDFTQFRVILPTGFLFKIAAISWFFVCEVETYQPSYKS